MGGGRVKTEREKEGGRAVNLVRCLRSNLSHERSGACLHVQRDRCSSLSLLCVYMLELPGPSQQAVRASRVKEMRGEWIFIASTCMHETTTTTTTTTPTPTLPFPSYFLFLHSPPPPHVIYVPCRLSSSSSSIPTRPAFKREIGRGR